MMAAGRPCRRTPRGTCGRGRAGRFALLIAVGMLGAVGPVASRAAGPTPCLTACTNTFVAPPLAPQAPVPAGTCSRALPPAVPNQWTQIGPSEVFSYDETTYDDVNYVFPKYQQAFDPADPCRVFRIAPTDASRLERSLDGGLTWSTVFSGGSTNGVALHLRRMYMVAPGHLYVTETGVGDTLIGTRDGGQTWQLASGAPGQGSIAGEFVYTLAATPQQPDVLYVATLNCYSKSAAESKAPACSNPPYQGSAGRQCPGTSAGVGTSNGGSSWTGWNPSDRGACYNGPHGPMRLFASHDGGATWTPILTDPTTGIPQTCVLNSLFIVIDPYASEHYWVGYNTNFGGANGNFQPAEACAEQPGLYPYLIEANGSSVTRSVLMSDQFMGDRGFIATRRPGGGLRLISWYSYSDDDWNTARPLVGLGGTPRSNPPSTDPISLPDGSALEFQTGPLGGIDDDVAEPRPLILRQTMPDLSYAELGATFNWPHYNPKVGTWFDEFRSGFQQTDDSGNYYLEIGEPCWQVNCDPTARDSRPPPSGQTENWPTSWKWQTLRYTPPAAGTLPLIHPGNDNAPSCALTNCLMSQLKSCQLAGDPSSDAGGSLAFDGNELYDTRLNDPAPDDDPYSAAIHVTDPRDCADRGTIVVHFDAGTYRSAVELTRRQYDSPVALKPPPLDTTLPAERPSIDSLTYDPHGDRLLFTLAASNAATADSPPQNNPIALWSASVPRAPGSQRSTSANLEGTGLSYCVYSTNSAVGAEHLAYDRATDSLWSCLPSRIAHVGLDTREVDDSCYGRSIFAGAHGGGWPIGAWTSGLQTPDGRQDHVFMWSTESAVSTAGAGPQIYDYDVRTCTLGAAFKSTQLVSSGTGSTQFPCDPVSDGPGGVLATGSSAVGAVLWNRHGSTLTANLIPSVSLSCTLPVTASLAGPATVARGSGPIDVCGGLTIDGPNAPARNQPATLLIDGREVAQGKTNAQGQLCAPFVPAADGTHDVRLLFAGNSAFFATSGGGILTVGAAPPLAPPPPPGAPAAPAQATPLSPVGEPPVVLAKPPLVAAAAPYPPTSAQPPSAPQSGAASEKEKQIQLAAAGQGASQQAEQKPADQPVDFSPGGRGNQPSLEMSMLTVGAAAAAFLTLLPVMAVARARAPLAGTSPEGRRRTRRRRRPADR